MGESWLEISMKLFIKIFCIRYVYHFVILWSIFFYILNTHTEPEGHLFNSVQLSGNYIFYSICLFFFFFVFSRNAQHATAGMHAHAAAP